MFYVWVSSENYVLCVEYYLIRVKKRKERTMSYVS
jgi:hypothetical protein